MGAPVSEIQLRHRGIGVTSLLLIRGARVPDGFEPRPKAVLDVSATELIGIATTMKADERLKSLPDFFVGGVVTPHGVKPNWVPRKLQEKIAAGAQFIQMHICMDVDLLRGYMKHLVAGNLIRRVSVMASVAVINSAEDANWLRENRPNVMIGRFRVNHKQAFRDRPNSCCGDNRCHELAATCLAIWVIRVVPENYRTAFRQNVFN